MESYATKLPEASGEEGEMARGTTKSLKAAAAAAAAAIGPHGLFAGLSAKGKADQEAAASSVEQAFAMAAVATAMAQKAMEAAQQATVLAAAASKQAEEAAASDAATDEDDDATDSDGEEDGGMTCLEYIMAYKQLPPFEVELILENPVERAPFTDSQAFKDLSADPSATEEDFAVALERHEERQDMRVRFQEYVRNEYEAYGCVVVSDEYIARRARTEELANKMWEEAFADFGEEDEESVN